jgi:hypothetical protein
LGPLHDRVADMRAFPGILLVAGVLAAVAIGLSGTFRENRRELKAIADHGEANEREDRRVPLVG